MGKRLRKSDLPLDENHDPIRIALDKLVQLDISLVYPEYFSRCFTFAVKIPPGKVARLRQRYRIEELDYIVSQSDLAQKILALNRAITLEPIQIEIEPPGKIYDPILQDFVAGLDQLRVNLYNDYFAYWFASLITFYRHNHIKSYDAAWQNKKYALENETRQQVKKHEDFRLIINNRAKRQLMRAVMKDYRLTRYGRICLIEAVGRLEHNDVETQQLQTRFLQDLGVCYADNSILSTTETRLNQKD